MDEGVLRAWAVAHEKSGLVQAKWVLELMSEVERLRKEIERRDLKKFADEMYDMCGG